MFCVVLWIPAPLICIFLLPQAWVGPWRASVCAPALQGRPRTWAEAAAAEAAPPAPCQPAAAGATAFKTSTWTLSSQRKWRCTWTPQALPPLGEGQPGKGTPPSAATSSRTHRRTNVTGWSDPPARVCVCVWGGRTGEWRGSVGLVWDRQTDSRL